MALSISRAWDETRAIIKRDGKLLSTIVAALILLPTALSGLVNPAVPGEPAADVSGVQSLLELVLGLIMQVGGLAVTAVALRNGTSVGDAIGTGLRKLLPALAAILLFVIPFLLLVGFLMVAVAGPEAVTNLESRLAAGDVDGSLLLTVFLAMLLFIYLAVRFMLIAPVAVAESDNPITILKRSWSYSRGHFWRLLAYVLILGFAFALVMLAVSFVLGGIVIAVLGQPEPMTLSALFLGLLTGLASAAFMLVLATMSARIYAQLVTGPSVPHVESRAG